MRFFYSVLFYFALPFIFLRLLWRARRLPGNKNQLLERLGFTPHRLKTCIWVHAVSVGETIAAIPLIKKLQSDYPHYPLLITNMTSTGAARVKAAFGETVLQSFIPYDTPDAVMRFLQRINPAIAIIMETELWPNLFALCHKKNIPVIVTNARLSQKSAQGYRKFAKITKNILQTVNKIAAQGPDDARRFIELGLDPAKISITGNIKFDIEMPADLKVRGEQLRQTLGADRLVWLAASTHAGEEEIILAAHAEIIKTFPDCLLILVPRHPDRFADVYGQVKSSFRVVKRSEQGVCDETIQVFLGDTMGEMLLMYAACDIAFVGGSFVPVGGHNMLEPALLARPIITGPQLFNFADISQSLLNVQGMIKVEQPQLLAPTLLDLFSDTKKRDALGLAAYQFLQANRGALAKQLALIDQYLVPG